ncbi:hypothetical protein Tco_0408220 [Tanacetum coccineum]
MASLKLAVQVSVLAVLTFVVPVLTSELKLLVLLVPEVVTKAKFLSPLIAPYLLDNRFHRGKIDQTLFIKKQKGDILLVQMSSIGGLMFFLGFQVKQKEDGIFISRDKYVADILRKFNFTDVMTASTSMDIEKPLLKELDSDDVDVHLYRSMIGSLMYLTSSRPDIMYLKGQTKLGLWYPRDSSFDLVAYSDSDYARASLDRKSTTGDGKVKIVTEASVRRHLQLADSNGISSLPTIEIFKQLSLMGRTTKQGSVVPQPRFFTHTHVVDEALSFSEDDRMVRATTTVSNLEARPDSGNINRIQSMATPPVTGSLGTSSVSGPGCHVTIGDTLVQTRSERVFTMPSDSPLPRVNILGSDEGSMQHKELMELCTKLLERVTSLQKEVKTTKQTYGAAYTTLITRVKKLEQKLKYRSSGKKIAEIDQDEGITLVYVNVETQGRYDDDMEFDTSVFKEQEVFLAAKDVTTAEKEVSTTARVSTTSAEFTTTSAAVSTASPTRTANVSVAETLVYIRRSTEKDKGKSIMQELDDVQAQIQADEDLAHRILEEERENYSFEEIEQIFNTVYKEVHTFVPMGTEVESERTKRAGQNLQQESSKRQKTGEASESAEEQKDKEADELSQEELQQMMIIVPEQGMNIIRVGNHTEIYQFFDDMLKAFNGDDLVMLWSLVKEKFNSTKPTDYKEREIWVELKRLFEPDTDDKLWKLQKHFHDLTWKLFDSCGVHHVSIEKGIDIYMLVEKEYPLSRGTLTLMLVAKLLVDQDNKMSRELLSKIFMQAERPKR